MLGDPFWQRSRRLGGRDGYLSHLCARRAAHGHSRALDPGHQASPPQLAADPAGNLHALWRRQDAGDTRLVYSVRRPDGVWQLLTPLPQYRLGAVAVLSLVSDSRGTIYALARGHSPYDIYLLGKPVTRPGGRWCLSLRV